MQKHNRSVFALTALLALSFVTSVRAQNDATDLYTSPNLDSGMAIPSGGINPGLQVDGSYQPAVESKSAAIPKDVNNILGCGGVGQGEYTSALFNMPETFGKFQKDVNSILAKQILAMNYIMPQTAALFDQLNNFGDQRYQIFQNGCNLDSLRQNAKDDYLKACVEKTKPERVKIINTGGSGGQSNNTKPPAIKGMSPEQIDTWAYAQAWEICSNQYVSDTKAFEMRTDKNTKFAEQVRRAENVTNALVPLLCPFDEDSKSDSEEGCWPELLIPQVRMCLEGTFGCETKENAYTVKEPLVGMQRMFDTMRYILDDLVIARRVNPFTSDLDKLPASMLTQAAREASLNIGYATLFRMDTGAAGDNKKPALSPYKKSVEKSVMDFQLGYLNCKNADIAAPLVAFRNAINKAMDKSKDKTEKPGLETLLVSDYKDVIKAMKIKRNNSDEITEAQLVAMTNLTWSALGCSANHTIPLFDPNIVASLNTRCLPQDRYAFYSMAGYDTSIAATRDIYRYLNNRLKQAYSRLMVDGRVPYGGEKLAVGNLGADTAASVVFNPELNRRLAQVVKEVMIPYVESQLERLDESQKNRGEFARRVQQIYADKSGCIYGGLGGPRSLGPETRQ